MALPAMFGRNDVEAEKPEAGALRTWPVADHRDRGHRLVRQPSHQEPARVLGQERPGIGKTGVPPLSGGPADGGGEVGLRHGADIKGHGGRSRAAGFGEDSGRDAGGGRSRSGTGVCTDLCMGLSVWF